MNQASIQKPVIVSMVLNVLLPLLITPLATKIQISPPNGAASLKFFDQIMHMFVHHAQVPFASTLIVAIIVAASIHFSTLI